jgi:hypothetical protein
MRGIPTDEERVSDIKKLLTCGTFYFAWSAPDQGSPIDLVNLLTATLPMHYYVFNN